MGHGKETENSHEKIVICNYHCSNCPGVIIWGGQYNSPRWELSGGITQVTIFLGGNSHGVVVLGGNCLGAITLSGNCPRGNCPRTDLAMNWQWIVTSACKCRNICCSPCLLCYKLINGNKKECVRQTWSSIASHG